MREKTVLFELIKTLSKTEVKRLVLRLELLKTQHAGLQLELFRCICSSRIIDTDTVKSRLQSRVLIDYLSYHKRALQEHILAMLSEDIIDTTHLFRNKKMQALANTMALYDRGFEQEAIKEISTQISKIDVELDAALKLLFLQEEYRMIRSLSSDDRKKKLEKVGAEKVAVLSIIRNETNLNLLNDQVYSLYQKVRLSVHADVIDELDELFKDELLSSEENAISFKARIDYYNAHMFRCSILGDNAGMIGYQEQVVKLWEQAPIQIKRKPFVYIYALINLLGAYMRKGQFQDFETIYQKAKRVKIENNKENASAFIALSNIWLLYLMNTQSVKRVKTFEKSIRAELKLKGKHALTGSGINLQYNLTSIHFLTGDFEKASNGFMEIIDQKNEIRNDLKGVSKILLTLSEFERKDADFVYGLNMSARRYYRTHNELDKMQGIVFKMVDTLVNAPKSEIPNIVGLALTEMEPLVKKKPLSIGVEEVEIWMQSRHTGIPIEQVWQERISLAGEG